MMTSERAAPPPGGEGGRRGPPVIMGTGGPSDRGGISSVEGVAEAVEMVVMAENQATMPSQG